MKRNYRSDEAKLCRICLCRTASVVAVQLDRPLRFGHVTVLAGGHQALHMFLQVDLPMNLDLLWHGMNHDEPR